ncbi:unnamed protein product [Acanthoscelides obtectus]|uniref:CCHC-type domain-containing protein n=1 Tax=Acanthoscelides obtectus TaxID=200917 RepID=A0A9P0QGK0_ACAOB|nr:unnamed protein product [Acanthoscelides obtectus]CAK1684682.1 hypothetical protein AOBTE_LOCUS35028 [Acanthoscelides obtectus]
MSDINFVNKPLRNQTGVHLSLETNYHPRKFSNKNYRRVYCAEKATFERTEGAMFVKRNYGKKSRSRRKWRTGQWPSRKVLRGSGVSEGARGSGRLEGRRTFRYKCHRCRKVGHKAAECPDKGKTVANSYKVKRTVPNTWDSLPRMLSC